jgi:hypothetical protein
MDKGAQQLKFAGIVGCGSLAERIDRGIRQLFALFAVHIR